MPVQEIPTDLPTDHLPQAALDAIRAITASPSKLDSCFKALRLEGVPGISEAWKFADKSTSALQAMCEVSIKAFLRRYPPAVQFVHLLSANGQDWIVREQGENHLLLTENGHCAFVLEWATTQLANDFDSLEATLEANTQYEQSFVEEAGLEPMVVPEGVRFLVGGRATDVLFGSLNIFSLLKLKSVALSVQYIIKNRRDKIGGDEGEVLMINILEAAWLDRLRGFNANLSVGNWLAVRSGYSVTDGVQYNLLQKDWTLLYWTWNMAFCTSIPSPQWVLAKLLIPCIIDAEPGQFFVMRSISLYLATRRVSLEGALKGAEEVPPVLTPNGTNAFGILNKRWAFDHDFDGTIDCKSIPRRSTGKSHGVMAQAV
jgi:hypothetical protein